MVFIRAAKLEDARAIHDAHMRSIQEICAKDYTPEQVKTWGGRPFNQGVRELAIMNDHVWVVDNAGKVEGYAHFQVKAGEGQAVGWVEGLYLTRTVIRKGFGRQLMRGIEAAAKRRGVKILTLNSTRTSLGFYQSMGFVPTGPEITYPINGMLIPCIPMTKNVW